MEKTNQSQQEREQQGEIIKDAVRATFEKLAIIESTLSDFQKIKSVLKRDLNDMAEGRLDRIAERQGMDTVSNIESVFSIAAKVEIGTKTSSPWYVPYLLTFRNDKDAKEVNNSISKTYAKGSYKLKNGEIKYL